METIFTSIKNLILESNLTTNKNLIMKKNITTKTFAYLLLKGNFLASKNGLIYLMLIFSLMSQGQSVGDYRTKATGNWNAVATWDTSKPSQPLVWDNALRFNTQFIEEFFAPLGSFEPSGIINIKPHFTTEE